MKTKILFILIALIGFGVGAHSQNVVIQTNEAAKSQTKDDCAYRISGICTTEDIGGVEVSKGNYVGNSYWYLQFINYNSFTVSVIYELEINGKKRTGTIVLKADETKQTTDSYWEPSNFKLIARKLKN
jgi:hypothetical protein